MIIFIKKSDTYFERGLNMSIYVQNEYGTVEMSNTAIATIVGAAATENFGVVGMASKKQVRDGINEILKRKNYSKGAIVRQEEGNSFAVDVYIIVSYGVKISEVSYNVQERVAYRLSEMLGLTPNSVNVYVQSVRVIESN